MAKLTNHNLKKQLRQFAKIEPSPTWLVARRSVLMNQIQSQVAERQANGIVQKIRLFVWSIEAALAGVFSGVAARGVAVAVLFVSLSLGASGYVLSASENSVPGDSLYQLKLAVEDTRLAMARSQQARVSLQVEFASRRLEEVKILAENRSQGSDHASVLVAQFQNDLNTFSQATNELSKTSPQNGAEVAKLLDGKLEDYKHTLTSTASADPALKKELNRAIASVSRTQTQALKVIVEDNETPDQEVVDKIADKIRLAEESLRKADARLTDDALFDGAGTKNGTITEVREQSAIAKINLVEARQKIDEGDYRAAVGIIDQIEDLVFEVEEKVDGASEEGSSTEGDSGETDVPNDETGEQQSTNSNEGAGLPSSNTDNQQ